MAAISLILMASQMIADENVVESKLVKTTGVFPELESYIKARQADFGQLSAERKADLRRIAAYVQARRLAHQPIRLTSLCTHNSRRSQMSQIWIAAAARYYGVEGVESYSGGTEATAFNPRAVAAVRRAGVQIEKLGSVAAREVDANPRYAVRFFEGDPSLICYSKTYRDAVNPTGEFCAVMTCSHADTNCPVVAGCELRVAITYDDPKVSDNSSDEIATYDERCRQICRDMLYLFSQVQR